ncbi:MAG TPA: Uma2 family endonuclease [Anaerolineae bacterium]|nr:Uma2 family endonuclease [Anaerolineae bacterium]
MASIPLVSKTDIFYPESDGKPMAETEIHINILVYLREALIDFFRNLPNAYVGANMLLYYEEGNPAASVAPDVFVIKGISKDVRRTFKTWIEGKAPDVIFELTSRSTWIEDLGNKRVLYERLGVHEYFIFDPLEEELDPPLQGFRLKNGEYQRIAPEASGKLHSEELGLDVGIIEGELRLADPVSGRVLPSPLEGFETAREALEAAQEAEVRAEMERQARRAVEDENARLRAELDKLRGKQE